MAVVGFRTPIKSVAPSFVRRAAERLSVFLECACQSLTGLLEISGVESAASASSAIPALRFRAKWNSPSRTREGSV